MTYRRGQFHWLDDVALRYEHVHIPRYAFLNCDYSFFFFERIFFFAHLYIL